MADNQSQSDRFKQARRMSLNADEDEAQWDERLREVVKQRPADEPEP
jgi:hypothetical protein